jgi:hypothetical protein
MTDDDSYRSWTSRYGDMFGSMTPFQSGMYSAGALAALWFVVRVAQVLIARMKARFTAARRSLSAATATPHPVSQPRKGSTKKKSR